MAAGAENVGDCVKAAGDRGLVSPSTSFELRDLVPGAFQRNPGIIATRSSPAGPCGVSGAGPTDPAGDILSIVDPLGSHGERQIDSADRVRGDVQLLEPPSDLAAALVDEADPSPTALAPTHPQDSKAESVVVDDEVARPQSADCVADRTGTLDPRFVERRQFGDRCCKVALSVALSGKALFESGNARVGLILRERSGQQRPGGVCVESLQQVGGHVVGGPKCRPQPEAFATGEARDLLEPDER